MIDPEERKPAEWMRSVWPGWSRVALALFFATAGSMHFILPRAYAEIVPRWLPDAPLLVAISGGCEILGGVGMLLPRTRRLAGWGLLALLVAVFPANVQMLLTGLASHASALWMAALWIRLPMQPVIMWWVWRSAISG